MVDTNVYFYYVDNNYQKLYNKPQLYKRLKNSFIQKNYFCKQIAICKYKLGDIRFIL